MSLHRATAAAALRAVGRRPTAVSTTTTRLTNLSSLLVLNVNSNTNNNNYNNNAALPTVCRAAVHDSSRRPQASNKAKNEPAHAGSFARTDDSITVEYPKEHELPASVPITGAGRHPTLATFSLEGKVSIVTGGARGLGLVMGQGLVVSGADLAIVDLNSMCFFFLFFLYNLFLFFGGVGVGVGRGYHE